MRVQLYPSLHYFMTLSLLSDNKDVMPLKPTKKISVEKLCNLVKLVIEKHTALRYIVISIITDSNRINEKMFSWVGNCSAASALSLYVENPLNFSKQIFFLFSKQICTKCIKNQFEK